MKCEASTSVLGTSNQNTKNTIRYLKGTPWSKWGQICVDSYGDTVTSWFIRSELLGLLFSTDSTAKQNSGRVENLPLHASHLVNQFEDALAALVQISIARLLHKAEVEHSTQSAWWCFCSICICSVCFSDCIDWLTHSIPKNRPKIPFAGFALMGLSMGEIICHGGLSQPVRKGTLCEKRQAGGICKNI